MSQINLIGNILYNAKKDFFKRMNDNFPVKENIELTEQQIIKEWRELSPKDVEISKIQVIVQSWYAEYQAMPSATASSVSVVFADDEKDEVVKDNGNQNVVVESKELYLELLENNYKHKKINEKTDNLEKEEKEVNKDIKVCEDPTKCAKEIVKKNC